MQGFLRKMLVTGLKMLGACRDLVREPIPNICLKNNLSRPVLRCFGDLIYNSRDVNRVPDASFKNILC